MTNIMNENYEIGGKVFHKSSGNPMVIIEVGDNLITTRWLDQSLQVQTGRFQKSEVIRQEDHPLANKYEELQKLKAEIELIQANEMLQQLKARASGIAPLKR